METNTPSGLVEEAVKEENKRLEGGGSAKELRELRKGRGEVVKEDFLDEGEVMLCPGMVYAGRHSSILGAGMMRANAQGWDTWQRGQAASMLVDVASPTISTELLGGRQDQRGCWASGSLAMPHIMAWVFGVQQI